MFPLNWLGSVQKSLKYIQCLTGTGIDVNKDDSSHPRVELDVKVQYLWWRLFQIGVVRTKLDIYVCIIVLHLVVTDVFTVFYLSWSVNTYVTLHIMTSF